MNFGKDFKALVQQRLEKMQEIKTVFEKRNIVIKVFQFGVVEFIPI